MAGPAHALLLTAALSTLPAPAAAIDRCSTSHKDQLDYFAEHFRETPIAFGVADTGGYIQILSSPDGGTFTILVTTPGGLTCVLSTGRDWNMADRNDDPGA